MKELIGINHRIKKVYDEDNIIGIISGNSHANRIIVNENRIFYINSDGDLINESIRQITYAKNNFKNLKFIILNITPIEMYAHNLSSAKDNSCLSSCSIKDYFNLFEKGITIPQGHFLKELIGVDNKNYSFYDVNSFHNNGRKEIPNSTHGTKIDWIRQLHYKQGIFTPSKANYNKNLKILLKMKLDLKKVKIVVISMPLNYRYIDHFNKVLGSKNLPNIRKFITDMKALFGANYINLINYPLDDKFFWDGDHLNKKGAKYMEKIINGKINKRLAPQYSLE